MGIKSVPSPHPYSFDFSSHLLSLWILPLVDWQPSSLLDGWLRCSLLWADCEEQTVDGLGALLERRRYWRPMEFNHTVNSSSKLTVALLLTQTGVGNGANLGFILMVWFQQTAWRRYEIQEQLKQSNSYWSTKQNRTDSPESSSPNTSRQLNNIYHLTHTCNRRVCLCHFLYHGVFSPPGVNAPITDWCNKFNCRNKVMTITADVNSPKVAEVFILWICNPQVHHDVFGRNAVPTSVWKSSVLTLSLHREDFCTFFFLSVFFRLQTVQILSRFHSVFEIVFENNLPQEI